MVQCSQKNASVIAIIQYLFCLIFLDCSMHMHSWLSCNVYTLLFIFHTKSHGFKAFSRGICVKGMSRNIFYTFAKSDNI